MEEKGAPSGQTREHLKEVVVPVQLYPPLKFNLEGSHTDASEEEVLVPVNKVTLRMLTKLTLGTLEFLIWTVAETRSDADPPILTRRVAVS